MMLHRGRVYPLKLVARTRGFSTAVDDSPHLHFRKYVDWLRQEGDLVDIKRPVDPHLEVGAITRRAYEFRQKAPLFHNITGMTKDGLWRILGAPAGCRKVGPDQHARLAVHFGLDKNATPKEILEQILSVNDQEPILPTVVESGLCHENVLLDDQVNFEKLPVPFLHEGDGGRYLQTYGIHVVRTPDGSWTSWSINRAMVSGKRELVGLVPSSQHIGIIHQMWKEQGKDTPWACVFGAPPAAIAISGTPLPEGVSEDGYVGAMCGQAVDIVKCKTNDLYVPANSEIVLEGTISATETALEGPMGEFHGFVFSDKQSRQPVFKVNAITYRNNPILPISVAGRAPDETHTIWGAAVSALILQVCRDNDLPIKMVWAPYEAQTSWVVLQVDNFKLRALKTTPAKFGRHIGKIIFDSHPALYMAKFLLVGEDVDPTDINAVSAAYATRYIPGLGEHVFDDVDVVPLIPCLSHGAYNKALIDCLLPLEYEREVPWKMASFEGSYPETVKQKVLQNWESDGFS